MGVTVIAEIKLGMAGDSKCSTGKRLNPSAPVFTPCEMQATAYGTDYFVPSGPSGSWALVTPPVVAGSFACESTPPPVVRCLVEVPAADGGTKGDIASLEKIADPDVEQPEICNVPLDDGTFVHYQFFRL